LCGTVTRVPCEADVPEDEGRLVWNDPELGIDWPVESLALSEEDLLLPTLDEIHSGIA
jgi:dTDP-4-dehydrorhamnose 3,5-epimerase